MSKLNFPKIIDRYIIYKFISTYVFLIGVIMIIVVMFDFDEKLDKFINNNVPTHKIILDYYLNFIPYIANLLSPLFVFISVIFFTSKLAYNSEIIAILSSGISFKRLMVPYILSASIIAIINFLLSSFIIPLANIKRINFCNSYILDKKESYLSNIQIEIKPGIIAYFEYFDATTNIGYRFSLEKFKEKELCSRLVAQQIIWNSDYHWTVKNYIIHDFIGVKEKIFLGKSIDTILTIIPSDFIVSSFDYEQMTTSHLKTYIEKEKKKGIGDMQLFEIEYYKRYAMVLISFILTIIGVSLSSYKIRGGIGMNIGIGLLLSFSYILFMQISSSFALFGFVSPFIAVWIPNIVYIFISVFLYKRTPK